MSNNTTSTSLFNTVYDNINTSNNTVWNFRDYYLPENKMNVCEFAKKHYPRTEDAILVTKWFGNDIGDFEAFLLRGREADLLAEAQRLEAEMNAKAKG